MIVEPRVTISEVRACKLCNSGGRVWAARHGFDWTTFVQEGYPVSRFDALDDGFAKMLADAARKRAAR